MQRRLVATIRDGAVFDQRRDGTVLAQEQIRLLTLVDIFEPLSREEIEEINWRHLNTSVEGGKTFYTPMDLCETLFVLQKGRVRIYRATPEGREFTLAVLQSGTVFGEMVLTGQRLRNCYAQAVEESEVSAMCRADVERLILDKPEVGLQLVHLLSDRRGTSEGSRRLRGQMEKTLIRQFQVEVERQCQFAMIALQDLEEASANSDGKLFWYSVQNLLVAVGRISRLLWPPDPLFPNRGAELRESLDVGEDSPLRALEFVEHFEHFDKRLETWYVTSEQRRFFDSYTEPLDVLADTAPVDRFRGYQTENSAVLFQGDAYELGAISQAVEELQGKAEAEMQKP